MSSATMDVSIDQFRGLPLEKRLEIIEALWDSGESELGPDTGSGKTIHAE